MNFDLKTTLKPVTDAVTNFVKNPVDSVSNFSGHVVKTVSNGGAHIFNTLNDIALKLTGNAPKVSFEKKDDTSTRFVGITVMSNTGKLDDDVNLKGNDHKDLAAFKRSIGEITEGIQNDVHLGKLSVSEGKYALNHLQKETTEVLKHLKTFDTDNNTSEAGLILKQILNKDTGSMHQIKSALKNISEKKNSNIEKETVEANSASKNHTVKQTIVYGKNTPYRLVVEQRNSKKQLASTKVAQAPINSLSSFENSHERSKASNLFNINTHVDQNDPLGAKLASANLTSEKIDDNLDLTKQSSFNRNFNFLSQQTNFKASNPVVREISLKMLEHLANPSTESSIFERDYKTLKYYEGIYPSNTPTGDVIDQALKLLESKITLQNSEPKNISKSLDPSKILNNEKADQKNKVSNTIIGQNPESQKKLTIRDLIEEINNTSFKDQTLLNNFNVASKEIMKPNANLKNLDRYYKEFKLNRELYKEDSTNKGNSKVGYLVNQMLDILNDKIILINSQPLNNAQVEENEDNIQETGSSKDLANPPLSIKPKVLEAIKAGLKCLQYVDTSNADTEKAHIGKVEKAYSNLSLLYRGLNSDPTAAAYTQKVLDRLYDKIYNFNGSERTFPKQHQPFQSVSNSQSTKVFKKASLEKIEPEIINNFTIQDEAIPKLAPRERPRFKTSNLNIEKKD